MARKPKAALRERTVTLDWEELRTVLAISREGSLSGAARLLELEHSSLYRRLQALEKRLGNSIFVRSRTGYSVNDEGAVLVAAALEMENAVLGAERKLSGRLSLAGGLRLATSELLGCVLLPAVLGEFMQLHPEIQLDLVVANLAVNLDRREADMALRATARPPEHLHGRRLAEVHYAVYASPALLEQRGEKLESLPWLGFEPSVKAFPNARWLAAKPEYRVCHRSDSTLALRELAAHGLGVAILPEFAGDADPRLVCLRPRVDAAPMPLWALFHPDVKGNPRIAALIENLAVTLPRALAQRR